MVRTFRASFLSLGLRPVTRINPQLYGGRRSRRHRSRRHLTCAKEPPSQKRIAMESVTWWTWMPSPDLRCFKACVRPGTLASSASVFSARAPATSIRPRPPRSIRRRLARGCSARRLRKTSSRLRAVPNQSTPFGLRCRASPTIEASTSRLSAFPEADGDRRSRFWRRGHTPGIDGSVQHAIVRRWRRP
jgi:hypothetical protein